MEQITLEKQINDLLNKYKILRKNIKKTFMLLGFCSVSSILLPILTCFIYSIVIVYSNVEPSVKFLLYVSCFFLLYYVYVLCNSCLITYAKSIRIYFINTLKELFKEVEMVKAFDEMEYSQVASFEYKILLLKACQVDLYEVLKSNVKTITAGLKNSGDLNEK